MEREFGRNMEKELPGFKLSERTRYGGPVYRYSPNDGMHFFLLLDFVSDRDWFDVFVGESTVPTYPEYTLTLLPTDTPENGNLTFPVGTLWKATGESPTWKFIPEPELDDIDVWLQPKPSVKELLPKVPEVVARCFNGFVPFLKAYIETRLKGRLRSEPR